MMVEKIQPFAEELRMEPILEKWQLLVLDLALISIRLVKRRLRARAPGYMMELFICGRQTVQIPVAVFGKTREVMPPHQADEEAVQDNLPSLTPCLFVERQTENDVDVTVDRVRDAEMRVAEILAAKGQETDFSNGNCARKLQRQLEYMSGDA